MNDNVQPPVPDPLVFIREGVNDLGAYVEMWAARGELPTPAELTAAREAIERIDATRLRLAELRTQLVTELQDAARRTMPRTERGWPVLRASDDSPGEEDR